MDIRKLAHKPSGIGMYIYNFMKGLIGYEGIEIIGITDVLISNEIKELYNSNLKIIQYGKAVDSNFEVFRYFNFVEGVLLKEQPDYFWEPNFIITKNLKRKLKNTQIIITIMDLIPVLYNEYYPLKYRIYFRYFLKKTIKFTDMFIFISNEVREQCELKYKNMIYKPNLLNYVIVEKEEIEKLEDKDYFLFIGNIEKRKGIEILLEAYMQYRTNKGSKKLKIIGSVRDENLLSKIEEYKNNLNSIEYYGYVTEEDKNELIRNCSALVFPSYVEGFGIPSLEALFWYKPIIVSNIAVFKEILGDCANYFKLDINDFKGTVNSLSEMLFKYEAVDISKVKLLKEKYSSKVLVENLISFLDIYKDSSITEKRNVSLKSIFSSSDKNSRDKSDGMSI